MVLLIDVGNTNIKVAGYKDEDIMFFSRLKTDKDKTDDEYMLVLYDILSIFKIEPFDIKGCVISSVVPSLLTNLKNAVMKAIGCKVLTVNSGIKTGLNIKIDNPGTLGSDFVAAGVGAIKKYKLPCLIISLGSATTFAVIDKQGAFIGGAILPGIDISLDALKDKTAQLQFIDIDAPKSVIGTNTVECMNAGVVYGTASMIDGMAQRYCEALKEEITVVATGGRAGDIVQYCRSHVILDDTLIFDGLIEIYRKNIK